MDSAQHDSYNAAMCQMPQLFYRSLETELIDRTDSLSCLCRASDGDTLACTLCERCRA